ncbi:hypothetical protein [Desulfoferrobacter suflitae]|uniref:hypothetical protein n=1 Tax=Desulfoferrobacter suflitae TaxID=2865782 RepID=UPI002164657D|nr:hypothetical protein [Desulfoferrobacter suflitae]MCK8603113.1 hypothetical protein [Desulfoferrobacter suflitae]
MQQISIDLATVKIIEVRKPFGRITMWERRNHHWYCRSARWIISCESLARCIHSYLSWGCSIKIAGDTDPNVSWLSLDLF